MYVQLLYANEAALRDVGVARATASAPREAYDLHILKFAYQRSRRGTGTGKEKQGPELAGRVCGPGMVCGI